MIQSPRFVLQVLLVAGLFGPLACSGSSEPDSAAEAGSASAPPATTMEPPPPPPRPEPELPEPMVILEDARETQSPSLVEAARRERERRETSERPAIVITDENLAEHATGQVTVAAPAETPESAEVAEAAEALELGEDEAYWRNGARERRLRLRRAVDEVLALEEQVAGLRLRFYAEDDPYVRDSRIKPAWDRSLERLRQARQDVISHHRDLQDFLEAGHEAGALPGWLREAAELEPTAEEIQEATPTDPGNRHWPQDPNAVDPVDPDQEDDDS